MENDQQRQSEGMTNKSNLIRTSNQATTYKGHLRYFSGKKVDSKALEPEYNAPPRMDYRQAGIFLGFAQHEIRILVFYGLMIPLGEPMPNSKKYFAKAALVQLANDVDWMHVAQSTLYKHWQTKNAHRNDKNSGERTITE